PLGFALSSVAHLGVLDRDAAVRRYAATNGRVGSASWIGVEVLLDDLAKRFESVVKWLLVDFHGKRGKGPLLKRIELGHQFPQRLRLLVGVRPVAIEPILDAGRQENRRT